MKFKIYKTSCSVNGSATAPCKAAEAEVEKSEYGYNSVIWLVEIKSITDLMELLKEVGVCVISGKREEEKYPELEIYDDHRE